jgi:enolase-phosphatase E1
VWAKLDLWLVKFMTSSLATERIRGVLLDIEGTTTPIAFVHEVLFSYARSQVRNFLTEHFGSAELLADLQQLREEHATDVKQNLHPPARGDLGVGVDIDGPRDAEIDSLVEYVSWLIDRDRKSTGLKSLQGKIWKQGYIDGTLKAELFADVAPALERWRHAGLKISIFSSGSSLAQKLLFAHTEAGDLTGFIDNYFDTTVGSKTDVASYRRIASAWRLPAQDVLFISDVVPELDAAGAAGMQTLLCVRPGNHAQPFAERYQTIRDFDGIPFAQRFA